MALCHEHRLPPDPKARRWAAGKARRGIPGGSRLIESLNNAEGGLESRGDSFQREGNTLRRRTSGAPG